MPQYVDTRQEKHVASSARWAAAAAKHRAAEAAARARGKTAAADLAKAAAEAAERHARTNARAAERLAGPAARARAARRSAAADCLDRATRLAAETPRTDPAPLPIASTGDRRAARQAEKRAQHEAQAATAEAARRRKAGVDHDPHTAAAQREVVVAQRRGADPREAAAVASLTEVASLIRNREERTVPRVRAMQQFDELAHRAMAGMYPEPRFERGVDRSRALPGVPDSRADALAEMQRLTAHVGVVGQALLYWRIFERRKLVALRDMGLGDERAIQAVFLAAVDATASFYGITPRPRAVEAMEERLAV